MSSAEKEAEEGGTIKSVQDFVSIALKGEGAWRLWRGHKEIVNDLKPTLFRNDFSNSEEVKKYEKIILETFFRYAPSVSSSLPGNDERMKWLSLLQNYGSPTRLLDWTEAPLNALFFSVGGDKLENDGEIFCLNPFHLNNKSVNMADLPLDNNIYLHYLIKEQYFMDNIDYFLEWFNKEIDANIEEFTPPTTPVAYFPPHYNHRMGAQMSWFTIHPIKSKWNSLDEDFGDSIIKYVVPGGGPKRRILSELHSLGVNYKSIFKDLDSLSLDLKYEYNL